MSRPRSAALTHALAALASGDVVNAAEAAKRFNVLPSTISRALQYKVCECCGQAIPKGEVHK